MGIFKLTENQANNQLDEWHNAYLSPTKKRGAVGVIQWEEQPDGRVLESRKWITLKNKDELLRMSNGSGNRLTNAFLTLNAFEQAEGQTRRRSSQLAQIRNIGVDIDCYNVGMTPEQARSVLQDMIVQCEIPNPNLVIWSGNGLQLVYSIEGGAAPQLAFLTAHITMQFIAKTTYLGADAACSDVARVFRLPGSYNQKPGKQTRLVRAEVWRRLEYDLSELYAYCEPLEHRQKRINKPNLYPLPEKSDMGFKLRSLNLARINDFYKLIELRIGNIEKRNVLLYDFAYCFGLQTDLEDAVIQQAARMNQRLEDPLSVSEVERVAKNAFKDARTFWKAYLDNGYTMNGLCRTGDGLIKPKRSTTIIKQHTMTDEELYDMQTIITKEMKEARRKAKRRAAGMKPLKEHNDQQKQQKTNRLLLLQQLKNEHPKATQKELAKMMNVSLPTVKKYIAELKEQKV